MEYQNRVEAGRWLALELTKYRNQSEVIVLGLQGGGVPIANEVSRSLNAPADIFVVRKLRLTEQPDVIIGALASGGAQLLNEERIRQLQITPTQLEQLIADEKVELEQKEYKYRGIRPFPSLTGKIVILVDDGIETGSSMRVALQAIKQEKPAFIVMAVPVAPPTVYSDFKGLTDEIICSMTPKDFETVHDYYVEYHTITDEEVYRLLEWASERLATA